MRMQRVVVMIVVVVLGAGMVMGQTEWVDDPNNPLFGPGDAGSWDMNGPWARAAVFDGVLYHLYFTGTDQNGLPNDMGHATSTDGEVWTMDPANPVLTRGGSGEWDEAHLGGAAVVHDGTAFHMWYSGMDGDFFERAGYATSPDGSVWTKHAGNPVMDVGVQGSFDDYSVRPTTVIEDGGTYRMWYGGGSWTGTSFTGGVGYAESDDGISWTKRLEPVLEPSDYPTAWDPGSVGNPYVVFDGSTDTYHMWYTGGVESSSSIDLSIGYAYSGDGIEWTKHRDNPVVTAIDAVAYHSPVLFDGSTFRMWYTTWDGSIDQIHQATSDHGPGVPELDSWRFIPAAAVAAGAQGAFFQTDVDMSNANGQSADYQFMWFPRGVDNSEAETSETFTLGAGKSARYTNVLTEVFDLDPDSLGALAIMATSPDLLAMSRTYNIPSDDSGGTFGQSMPAIPPDGFIKHGEVKRILFGSENAEMRTNIGCQNGTERSTVVYLDLFDDEGVSLGREMLILKPLGNDQVNRIFDGHNPVNGYVDVSLVQAERSVYCYGSVLDNVTSDPTTILPQ